MIKTISHIGNICRRTALIKVIDEQLKDAHQDEHSALLWAKFFIKEYEFKEGHGMEPMADLMRLFGMFVIRQYKEIESC